MEPLLIMFVLFLVKKSRSRRIRNETSCNYFENRRKEFQRRQCRERLMFVLLNTWMINTFEISSCRERKIWSKTRSRHWWDRIVNEAFSNQDWMQNFRMSKTTFRFLCDKLDPAIKKMDTNMRKAIPVEIRVAITLWRLATNVEYRTIGHLFGISRSSVCVIVHSVIRTICKTLKSKFIRFPKGLELEAVVRGYEEKWGFPQCGGAIDGSHIPIIAPNFDHISYYNRKGFYSIVLQATVDDSYCFTDVMVGWPGSVHDARVLSNSSLYQKGLSGTLFQPGRTREISGTSVPIVLLGDPAYPLLPWLMKPFSDDGQLTRGKARFNFKLSSARMTVENAFGRLKGRWRCLLKRNDTASDKIPKLVTACCVLHNICEKYGESFDDEWRNLEIGEEITEDVFNHQGSTILSDESNAQKIREALVDYLDP